MAFNTLPPDTARRLAFIRLLLTRASEESRLAPPYCFDGVNRLHDVAEMFLALAAQQHSLQQPKDFMAYWGLLEKPLGRPLGYRSQAERFNKVRVAWKHYGAEPSVAEIEAARAAVTGLLEGECSPLFGIDLADVSLTAFVQPDVARDLVGTAEAAWKAGGEDDAFGDLAEAFDIMISDYTTRKQQDYRSNLLSDLPDFAFANPRGLEDDLDRLFEKLIDGIKALDKSVTLIGIGVDLRRLSRFRMLTPRVTRYAMGHRGTHEPARKAPRTDEDFNYCRDFVVNTAIHLAEFDFDVDPEDYVRGEFIYRRKLPGDPLAKDPNA
jgi:hypothetical protein